MKIVFMAQLKTLIISIKFQVVLRAVLLRQWQKEHGGPVTFDATGVCSSANCGAMGCALSHFRLWQQNQDKELMVVAEEDDVPAEASADVALVMSTSAMRSRRWLSAAGHGRGEGFGMIVLPRRAEPRERSTPQGGPLRPVPAAGGSGRSAAPVPTRSPRHAELAAGPPDRVVRGVLDRA